MTTGSDLKVVVGEVKKLTTGSQTTRPRTKGTPDRCHTVQHILSRRYKVVKAGGELQACCTSVDDMSCDPCRIQSVTVTED